MQVRLRSWWQQIKQHRVAIGVCAIVCMVIFVIIIIGYQFDWTGFNGYNKVTITHTTSGPNAGIVTRTEEYQPGKSLWDWLQLLGVLAIPVAVGLGAAWYTARQSHDLEIMADNQRETALQAFIDKIPDIKLLQPSLARTKEQIILKARTLALLPSLDANRKRTALMFLYELELVYKNENNPGRGYPIIELSFADLSGANLAKLNLAKADLRNANLRNADLSGANLRNADLLNTDLSGANLSGVGLCGDMLTTSHLREANMRGANLSKVNLFWADLRGADLSEADLSEADLRGVDLSSANLCGANLHGANLDKADLRGADLSGTNLKEVIGISIEKLEMKAKTLKGATKPDGSIHP